MTTLFSSLLLLAASSTASASPNATEFTTDPYIATCEEAVDTAAGYTMAAEESGIGYRWRGELMGQLSSNGRTPFWLTNNRWGLSSTNREAGYVRGSFQRIMDPYSRWDYGYGVDLAGASHFTSKFIVQQLYAEARYRCLEICLGAKERYNGLVDQTLSSGDLLFSQNARPIPQLFLSMPHYEPVPFTHRWLQARMYASVGMFTDWRWQRHFTTQAPNSSWTEKALFHSKGLFLKVADPGGFPLQFEGGLEMGAQWGGTAYRVNAKGEVTTIHMGRTLKDFVKTVIPMGGGSSDDPNQAGEISNVYGNHTGQWSAAITWLPDYNLSAGWGTQLYYQHYFEDHSMMFFDHLWKDMLLGVRITPPANRWVTDFVYEYINTRDQSGPIYHDRTPQVPEQVSGTDGYYNHYIYSGWQHWGMGMGNPLLISPIYNADHRLKFYDNRIKGHHFGLKGAPLNWLSYKLLLSYTRSWGEYGNMRYDVAYNVNSLLELSFHPRRLSGWEARLGLAADSGHLLGRSYGAMITLSKTGWL